MKPLGLILAGGQGRRMGGTDKALMTFRGRPLIEHAIDCLAPQVSQIILNINRHHARFSQYGYPLITDTQDQYQGPLVGILSVLEALDSQQQFEKHRNENHHIDLLVVPCDSPFFPSNLCSQLQQTKHQHANTYTSVVDKVGDKVIDKVIDKERTEPAIIAHDGARLQPLFILLSTYHLPELRAFINSGNRKVLDWIALVKPIISQFNNSESLFCNINSIEDLEKIEKYAK